MISNSKLLILTDVLRKIINPVLSDKANQTDKKPTKIDELGSNPRFVNACMSTYIYV